MLSTDTHDAIFKHSQTYTDKALSSWLPYTIFIDQILKFGDIFNEQDIKDEINTLIVAVK